MTADLPALRRVLSRTALRLRVQRALDVSARVLIGSSMLGTGALLVVRPSGAWLAPLALSAGAALVACSWPLAAARVAALIDERCALDGRIETALGLRGVPGRFAHAALQDAEAHARGVLPSKVWPLHVPRTSTWAALSFVGCAWLGTRPPASVEAPASVQQAPRAPLLDDDELAQLRAELPEETTAALAEPLRSYQALLQHVAEGGASASASIAAALTLESRLAHAAPADDADLEDLASALQRAQPALAEALRSGRLHDAAAQLRQLAARVRDGDLSASERASLASALERARARARQRANERDPEPDLLKHRERAPHARPSTADSSERDLQTLSRELARAAAGLPEERDSQRAGEALSQSADALDRLQRQRRESEQQRALSHAVAQLRELLQRRALARTAADAGTPREAANDAPGSQGSAQAGASTQEARRRRFREHAGGAGAGSAPVESTALMESAGERVLQISEVAGREHDPTRGPASPARQVSYQDLSLQGANGRGPTRSQVIRSAAEGGFANARYRKVYQDYRAHAEALIEHDEVPAGARFHVRRYFELVRPRGQEQP